MPTTHTNVTHKLDRFLGKCSDCVRPMAVEHHDVPGDFLRVPCPECSRNVRLERLYGTETTMTCDPRCEGAVGSDCECACGGANHGGAFLLEGEALASAVDKYRRQANVRAEAAKKGAAERARKAEEARQANLSEEERWITSYEGDSSFLNSLKDQAEQGFRLSDRQVQAIRDNIDREARRLAAIAPRKNAVPCPEGEGVVIEGKVVKLDTKEYAQGPALVGRILTEAGWSAWGTIPRALREPVTVEVGQVVRFTATMKRKDDTFGFWSYPEGGEIL